MVQPIDSNFLRPIYNAVDIHIRKPEVNAAGAKEETNVTTDNGIYNAVSIDIDRPSVNTEPQKVYDYPEYDGVLTYDMVNQPKVELPSDMSAIYYSRVDVQPAEEEKDAEKVEEDTKEKVDVPAPNFTTLEAEKEEALEEKKTENIENDVSFHGTDNAQDVKRPEIVPGEEIKPDVDIAKVVSNLKSENFDTQALQMEEIARLSMASNDNAVNYIVRDVFSSLIDISKKDTSKLEAPSKEQVEVRKKLIADFLAIEKNPKSTEVPYKLSEEEVALAAKLSPMEEAERNKEYALYTMAVLAKVYVEEIKKETGKVVPMTDVPGMSAMVDAVKDNPNSGVKVAALDALSYVQQPEYKDELNTIYTLAQQDNNPQVVMSAKRAQAALNKN